MTRAPYAMPTTRTMAQIALILSTSAFAAAMTGCGKRAAPSNGVTSDAAAAAEKPLRHRAKTRAELPTTSAEIYLGNLDAQISELTRLTVKYPDILQNVQTLGAAHYARGRYRGDLDEIQLGIDGASACLRAEPANAGCYLTRAEEEQSLHRFAASRADLEKAVGLGGDAKRISALRAELDWNEGRYDVATPALRKERVDHPSTATWIREALLDHDLDPENEAAIERAYETAEDLLADTAPLPVANLDVQRGMEKAQRGKLDEACVFYREAIGRMPLYIAANEHLAEALHQLGNDDEAISIYERVVKLTGDPEFLHALAALYQAHGRKDEARALEAKAATGYDVLLTKYPEAMYWHASEYFLSIGENAKALDLLQKNLTLRPNSTSYVALAGAQLSNGRAADAKASIDKALAMPLRSATLYWTAAAVYRTSGAVSEADGYLERARRLNPRIEAQSAPNAPDAPDAAAASAPK